MIDTYEKHTCTECNIMFTSGEELKSHHSIDHGISTESSVEWNKLTKQDDIISNKSSYYTNGKLITWSSEDSKIAQEYLQGMENSQRVQVASEQRLKMARDQIRAMDKDTDEFYEQILGESNGQDFSSGAGTINPLATPKFKYSKNNKLADTIHTKGYNPNPNAGLYDNKEFKEGGVHLEDPLAKEDFEVSFYGGESKANEVDQSEVSDYLDELRESGRTNMFGARPYIEAEFGVDSEEAGMFLQHWMDNFGNESSEFGDYEVKCDCDKDPDCKTCGGKGTNTWSSTVYGGDEAKASEYEETIKTVSTKEAENALRNAGSMGITNHDIIRQYFPEYDENKMMHSTGQYEIDWGDLNPHHDSLDNKIEKVGNKYVWKGESKASEYQVMCPKCSLTYDTFADNGKCEYCGADNNDFYGGESNTIEDFNKFRCSNCSYQTSDQDEATKHKNENNGHDIEMYGKGEFGDSGTNQYKESYTTEDFSSDYQTAMDNALGLKSVSSHYKSDGVTCSVCGETPTDKREHLRKHYGIYFDQIVASEGMVDNIWGLLVNSSRMQFLDEYMGDMNIPLMITMGEMSMPETNQEVADAIGVSKSEALKFISKWSYDNGITNKIYTESKASEYTLDDLADIGNVWDNSSIQERKKIIINTHNGYTDGHDDNIVKNWNELGDYVKSNIAHNWNDALKPFSDSDKSFFGLESKATEDYTEFENDDLRDDEEFKDNHAYHDYENEDGAYCKKCLASGNHRDKCDCDKSDESLKADWDESGYEEKYSWLKDLGVDDAYKYANMTLYELPENIWSKVNEDYVRGFKELTSESYTPDQQDIVETVEEKIISRKLDNIPTGQIARELVLWNDFSEEHATKLVGEVEPSDNDMVARTLFNKRFSECNESEIEEMKLYDS